MLISSGTVNGEYEKTSEVLNLETGEQCYDWIDFPVNPGLEGATGVFLGNVSVICGGITISGGHDNVTDECYSLNATFTESLQKMKTQRNSIYIRMVSY